MNWSQFFSYDADTGRLLWKSGKQGRGCVEGREAGTTTLRGYRAVMVDSKKHYAHRIVWEMINGPIPDGLVIDHIDGNCINNRISNLRLVTLSGNQRNARIPKNNSTGIVGVYQKKRGYVAICGGKYVGYFGDFFSACCARKSAERKNGFHENHGRRK